MGIRFSCPSGHKLNVKTFLAGKRGVCPQCGAKFVIPTTEDSADFEAEPSIGAAQSHSIEVIAPPGSATTSAVASPSIIIAIADSPISAASPSPKAAPGTPPVESSSSELPQSIVVPPELPVAIQPV